MVAVTVANKPASINRCVSGALILLFAAAAAAATEAAEAAEAVTAVNKTTGGKMESNDAQCRSVQSDAWLDGERVRRARLIFTAAVELFDEATTGLSMTVVRVKSVLRGDRQLERRQVTIEGLARCSSGISSGNQRAPRRHDMRIVVADCEIADCGTVFTAGLHHSLTPPPPPPTPQQQQQQQQQHQQQRRDCRLRLRANSSLVVAVTLNNLQKIRSSLKGIICYVLLLPARGRP